MKLKKIFCLLLCGALMIGSAGCGSEEGQESNDASSAESPVENSVSSADPDRMELLDNLGGKYAGREYTIVTAVPSIFESSSDDPLGVAVKSRNALLTQSFDIRINVIQRTESQIKAELASAVEKGDHYADLICAPAGLLCELAAEGLLENMGSLPYLDESADYIDSIAFGAQSSGNTAYFLAGGASLAANSASVLFYDKSIVAKSGVDPAKLANDGNLTWDALSSIASAAAKAGECYGIDRALGDEELLASIYASSGKPLVTTSAGKPQASYDSETSQRVNAVKTGLFDNENLAAPFDAASYEKRAVDAFVKGKTAFMMARLDNVAAIKDKPSEWGILPIPKLEGSQSRYYCAVTDAAASLAVPRACKDSAFAGFMLNAVFAAGADNMVKSLKSTYVNYYFWSNDAALMLDKVEKSLFYDFGILYSDVSQVYAVTTALLGKIDTSGASDEDKDYFQEFIDGLFR